MIVVCSPERKVVRFMLISFDLDGVLIVNPFGKGIFPEVVRTLEPYVTSEHLSNGQTPTGALSTLVAKEARNRLHSGDFVSAYDWDAIYNHVAHSLNSPDRFHVGQLVEKFCGDPGMISLYHPDVPMVLARLKRDGHTLIAMTNGYLAYQLPVLKALDINRYFSGIVTPDQTQCAKPQPEIFVHARAIAPNEQEILHVGDTLTHDVLGAKRAGIPVAWLTDSLPRSLADLAPADRATNWPINHDFAQARFDSEFCTDAYGNLTLRDCRPDFVIRDVTEVPSLV